MKTIKNIIFLFLALPLLISSCEKAGRLDAAIEGSLENKARIRLYNFAINSPSANFYSNETKISGTLSATGAEAVGGVGFGGTYPTNQYALAPVGTREIRHVTSSTLTTDPNVTIAKASYNFVDQKYYSAFTSGIYDAVTKTADAFVVEDNFPTEIDQPNAYIRIVNPGHNTTTITMVLQKTATVNGVKTILEEVTIGTGIAYKQASPFVAITPGAWELLVTDQGSGKTAVRAATSFLKDRVYTIALRGNIVTGTPATFLDNTVNK